MAEQTIKVCIVAGDHARRASLEQTLVASSYPFAVRSFPDPRELYAGLLHTPCQLLLIGPGLQGEDGLAIIRQLAGALHSGFVVLTRPERLEERVEYLLNGADACLAEPAAPQELLATLLSVHRRLASVPTETGAPAYNWQLQDDGWTLRAPAGVCVALTPSERTILLVLHAEAGRAVQRERLIRALGHDTAYYLDHRLDMLIGRLRRKVRETVGLPLPLRAVRGVGFMLAQS